MQELQKALDISVSRELQYRALAAFEKQLAQWDVKMPKVEPLVLDFGLGNYYDTGLIEFWICNEVDAGYCGKYLFVFDGQTCPMHRHKLKTETFFVVKGTISCTWKGETKTLEEGDTLLLEPWTPHAFTGVGPALVLEVSTPCLIDDNYFENPNIPIGGNYGGNGLQGNGTFSRKEQSNG